MAVGYNDMKNVVRLPGTWDTAYLDRWRNNQGVQFGQLAQEVATALTVFNGALLTGYWSRYITTTTELTQRYRSGSGAGVLKKLSEHTPPDPIHSDNTGHMLPMADYGGNLGWTYWALRRAKMGMLQDDVRTLIDYGQNTWEQTLLTRLFKSTADTVGSSGVSVPFADGGTADANFIPPNYNGQAFASSHSHFLRYADDAAGRLAFLIAAATHLKEHGKSGPYELVIPEVDESTWSAVTGWIYPTRTGIVAAGVQTRVMVDDEYIGAIETPGAVFYVKSTPRLPTDYAGVFKPMGLNAADNPLLVRYEEGYPLGLTLVGEIKQWPLEEAISVMTFGVGVGDRLSGVAGYFAAAGSYTSPTIS
jgi:hypothetical protein